MTDKNQGRGWYGDKRRHADAGKLGGIASGKKRREQKQEKNEERDEERDLDMGDDDLM